MHMNVSDGLTLTTTFTTTSLSTSLLTMTDLSTLPGSSILDSDNQGPIASLAVEIIAEIFLFAFHSRKPAFPARLAPPLVFLFVSRRWRTIALSMHSLWADVVLDEAPRRVRDIKREKKALEVWLERSGRMEMSLKMMRVPFLPGSCITDLVSHLNPGMDDRRVELGAALGEVLRRCRYVEVHANASVIEVVVWYLRRCAATGPLRQLVLKFLRGPFAFGPQGFDDVHIDLSDFHRLHLLDVRVQPRGASDSSTRLVCAPPTRPFPDLYRFVQDFLAPVSPNVAVKWMTVCPKVQTLAVTLEFPDPTVSMAPCQGEVPVHAHLQELWLTVRTKLKTYRRAARGRELARQTFNPIHLPSLRRLTLDLSLQAGGLTAASAASWEQLHFDYGRVLTRITRQMLRDSPQLTALTLLGMGATAVKDILFFLDALPTLTELTIDGGFKDLDVVLMALSPHDCTGAADVTKGKLVPFKIRGLCPALATLTINNFSWTEQWAVHALVCSRWAVGGYYTFPCDICSTEIFKKTANITRHHLVKSDFKRLTVDPPFDIAKRIYKELREDHSPDLYRILSPTKMPLKEILEGCDFMFYEVDEFGLEPTRAFL